MHLALLLLALTAPVASIADDGSVVGTLTVAAPLEAVRARVGDALWIAQIADDGTDVSVAATDGACRLLDYTTSHSIATVRYQVRQCPVDGGFDATLVQSKAFKSYATSWRLTEADGGTAITYRIHLISTLAVPDWIIRRTTRSSVERMMLALERAL